MGFVLIDGPNRDPTVPNACVAKIASSFDPSKASVLVVDGNSFHLRLTMNMLRAIGVVNVATVTDAVAALEQLNANSYDCAIIDADFDDCLNGLEIVQIVRSSDSMADPYLPVVLLGTKPERDLVFQARDAGVHEFLRRPFSTDQLYERLLAAVALDRQFVRSASYRGPDRRRLRRHEYDGPERRRSLAQSDDDAEQEIEIF